MNWLKQQQSCLLGLILASGISAGAAEVPQWDMTKLTAPTWSAAPDIKSKYPNIKGIFYQGLPYGKMPSFQVLPGFGLPEKKRRKTSCYGFGAWWRRNCF